MEIDQLADKIISSPLFLKLKEVIENNAYHDHETMYDHMIKTFKKAKEEIEGKMITDNNAREKYLNFINEEIGGMKKKELMQILALVHDIGKLTRLDLGDKKTDIEIKMPDGNTKAPGHEYAGSLIAKQVLEPADLSEQALEYITKGIRLHGVFNDVYQSNVNANMEELEELVKRTCENMHVEMVFNSLCDCYSAEPFLPAIPKITELFNSQSFYNSVNYSIK